MTHLVGDPLAGRGRFVRARRHVDVVVIEEDPGVGALAGKGTFLGQLLDETGDGRHGSIHGLVEPAVQLDSLDQACRTNRGITLIVPGDHLGGDGHRRDLLG